MEICPTRVHARFALERWPSLELHEYFIQRRPMNGKPRRVIIIIII